MPKSVVRNILRIMDRVIVRRSIEPKSHQVGARGEELAYFYLRDRGYTLVARNWRTSNCKGELDLVGWEDGVLCFVEVKTRSKREAVPAEMAVDLDKQRVLRQTARRYLKRVAGNPTCRFDIVSLYLRPDGKLEELTLFRNAFPMA